jgi:uncharacterized membrane protein SpoIIM required for sporulation
VSTVARVRLPAALWTARWWVFGAAFGSLVVAFVLGVWVDHDTTVQATIGAPDQIRQLVDHDFEDYYSAHPAAAFAWQVWTNNAWVAAQCIASGALFVGVPVIPILFSNAANLGVSGGLMAANGKLGLFFGLITPHGLLELTAVFTAAGVGMALGWSLIDPGEQTRAESYAAKARGSVLIALGLVVALAASGFIEAFVTPSGLPTWARIAIGVVVWAVFLTYVAVLGRRAVAAGDDGSIDAETTGDVLPTAG